MTTAHNGMEKYDIDDVPTGTFWYREEFKLANKQQVVWTHWEVVYVHDREYRGKLRRHISAQFWSSNVDDTRRKLDKGGFVCEFYQIPLPPGHPDEDKGKTQESQGPSMRTVGDVAGPVG